MEPGRIILGALVIAGGIYYQLVQPNSADHPNAPEGAIEYFENSDNSQWVALFDDTLLAVDEDKEGEEGEMEIPLSNIKRVRTFGYILSVIDKEENELQINLPSTPAAKRVQERIAELIE